MTKQLLHSVFTFPTDVSSLRIDELFELTITLLRKTILVIASKSTYPMLSEVKNIVSDLSKIISGMMVLSASTSARVAIDDYITKINFEQIIISMINKTTPSIDVIRCRLTPRSIKTFSAEILLKALMGSISGCMERIQLFFRGVFWSVSLQKVELLSGQISDCAIRIKTHSTLGEDFYTLDIDYSVLSKIRFTYEPVQPVVINESSHELW